MIAVPAWTPPGKAAPPAAVAVVVPAPAAGVQAAAARWSLALSIHRLTSRHWCQAAHWRQHQTQHR
ncbi:MAG TPA: hypothetical protein VFR55_08345 [Dehalococcoidia bacterium]|nr:hypothetical protein [Dehalococcoidia bacterium]